jgi:superkiller protein 3
MNGLSISPIQLPALYNDILNHPNTSNDLRRATDSKLLRHKQRYLHSLPVSSELSSLKAEVASELESLVNGAVILLVPDELAWTTFIEGRNSATVGGLRSLTLSCPFLTARVSQKDMITPHYDSS